MSDYTVTEDSVCQCVEISIITWCVVMTTLYTVLSSLASLTTLSRPRNNQSHQNNNNTNIDIIL